jgi:hypothetical protein
VRIDNFSASEIDRAAQAREQFDIAYLFSTKWKPPHPWFDGPFFGKRIQERFFDYHEDLSPEAAANVLGGRVLVKASRNNEWVALVAIEKVENAELQEGIDHGVTERTGFVESTVSEVH